MIDELVWMYFAYKIGKVCFALAFIFFAVAIGYLLATIELIKFSRTVLIVLLSVFVLSSFVAAISPSIDEIKAYIVYRAYRDGKDQKEVNRLIELIPRL
jgi:uncharacterized membrane-anchored protein YitT (DUF2179 family)